MVHRLYQKKINKEKVVISGLGSIGAQHLSFIEKNKNLQLISVYDTDKNKYKNIKNKETLKSKTFSQLLNNKVNHAIIASPDEDHCSQIIRCLKKEINIFCEKPLCNSSSELKAIYKEWKKNNNIKIKTNLLLRTADLYIWLKKKIQTGYFGKIYSIDAEYLYGRKEKITNGWRRYSKNYSGMRGGGVHMIDLMIWLIEELPTSVTSFGNKIALKKNNLKFDDYLKSVFNFKSGLIGQINANLACVHKHHHTMKIYGSKKTFIYDDKGPRIHSSRNENSLPNCPRPRTQKCIGYCKIYVS